MPAPMVRRLRHRLVSLDRGQRLGASNAAGRTSPRPRLRMARARNPGAQPVAAAGVSGDGGRMSDYLGNLAARSLDAVATIRPRLASFYEAPQRGFALPAEPSAESSEATNDVVATPAQRREERAPAASKPLVVTVDLPVAAAVADDIQPPIASIAA